MDFVLKNFLLSLGLFAGMLALMEIGRRTGLKRLANDPEGIETISSIEAAVFALLGLLLAFTISGAGGRLDARRQLIIEETNAIGTAYLRLDLLPEAAQPSLRDAFRRYVDTRIDVYRKLPDAAAAFEELAKADNLQQEIWRQAVAAVRAEGVPPPVTILLLPALNVMIDITTTRTMATQMHPPPVIFIMLYVFALASALLVGYRMAKGKTRGWLHMLIFAFVTSVSFFVIRDLEFPRAGIIRLEAFDQALVDLRKKM